MNGPGPQSEFQPQPVGYYSPAVLRPPFDRSMRLLIFGILFVLGGMMCGLMTVLVLAAAALVQQAAQPQQMKPQDLIGALAVYGGLAVTLVTLGVGSIRKRRWVRPLVLTLGVLMGLIGVVTMLVMGILLPSLVEVIMLRMGQAPRGGRGAAPTPEFARSVLIISMGFMFVLMVALPLVVTLFYLPRTVKQTLEHYDLQPRWTDACPLPVLGLAIKLGLVGVLTLPVLFYPTIPVGPFLLRGPVQWATVLLLAGLFFVMARLVYQQKRAGWWLMVMTSLGLCGMLVWSGISADWAGYLDALNLPPDQRASMDLMIPAMGRVCVVTGGLFAVLLVGYALSVQKYFR